MTHFLHLALVIWLHLLLQEEHIWREESTRLELRKRLLPHKVDFNCLKHACLTGVDLLHVLIEDGCRLATWKRLEQFSCLLLTGDDLLSEDFG